VFLIPNLALVRLTLMVSFLSFSFGSLGDCKDLFSPFLSMDSDLYRPPLPAATFFSVLMSVVAGIVGALFFFFFPNEPSCLPFFSLPLILAQVDLVALSSTPLPSRIPPRLFLFYCFILML